MTWIAQLSAQSLSSRILVAAAADAGIGEEDVDRPVMPLGLGDQVPDVGFLGDVAGDGDALDVLGDGLETAGIAVGHDHALGAFLGIAPRDRLADAARRAGDDADLVLDLHLLPINASSRGAPRPSLG